MTSYSVVFDLDGTLIDSLPDVTKAVNLLLADQNLPTLSQKTVTGFVGRGERVLLQRVIEATDLPRDGFETILPRFIEFYKIAARDARVFPGVFEALSKLRQRGFSLGLVTNKPRGPLIPTLEAAGLSDAFEAVVAGDDLSQRKPDPAPLAHAFQELGGAVGVYVGDSEVDAETANRASVPFVLFTKGIRTSPVESIPHAVAFDDFSDLPSICTRLREGQ